MKGPFRELLPVSAQVNIKIPGGAKPERVHLLVSEKKVPVDFLENRVLLTIPQILDHEIVGIDFT
jgi:hypothetical protein